MPRILPYIRALWGRLLDSKQQDGYIKPGPQLRTESHTTQRIQCALGTSFITNTRTLLPLFLRPF